MRRVRLAGVHHRRLAAHARGPALVLHARGLPLARRAHADARQDPGGGAASEEAGAGPGLRVRNFQEVSYGYDSELAVAEASRCLQCKKPTCVDGCPVGVDIPGFVAPGGRGRLRRRGAAHPREERAARRLRARLPAGRPVREGVPAGQQGRAARHRRAGAVRRRLRARDRPGDAAARGRPTGKRVAVVGSGPGRTDHGRRPGRQGPQRDHLRGAAQPGRRARRTASPSSACRRASSRRETGNLRHLGVKFELNSIVGKLYGLDGTVRPRASTPSTWPPGRACPGSWACPARTSATSSPPTSTSRA